jgi:hypothetical protein
MNKEVMKQVHTALDQEPIDLAGLFNAAKRAPVSGILAGVNEAQDAEENEQLIAAHYLRGYGWPFISKERKHASQAWLATYDPLWF